MLPAAIGMPRRLYIVAATKLIRILKTVFFERSIAATTSKRSFCGNTVATIMNNLIKQHNMKMKIPTIQLSIYEEMHVIHYQLPILIMHVCSTCYQSSAYFKMASSELDNLLAKFKKKCLFYYIPFKKYNSINMYANVKHTTK